ncbi:DUF3786 domain-containing protein [Desulfococcus multivorans]|uniref:DUF3786 domain-containing protein n=1 Tax=Desulfococcus multivorans DSM 2059 TaxID=1121405 RepID=S7UU43_DESML|nr:DUF3786 domain-containing protein [Desulfococcus multivorans]AOY59859.1 conserved uncharacterized protein [Desulfococcus multivorans]AQV02021.1 hypothetical protein B2D07_15465 [Desulfococcus multivorans]EPR35858.1 protein of unknown function DUF3786 [Desulfococcus multivorans DSM 2059]SJZ34262.1 protein of unknown function [Desulfococcus multivorans DSM 2059]
MARMDDYLNARKIAVDTLAAQPFEAIKGRSGLESPAENELRIPFLNRVYRVTYPEFRFEDATGDGAEIPVQEQVLILHYLTGGSTAVTEEFIAYREIEGAAFYFSSFVKRAVDPLKKVFGRNADSLGKPASILGGTPIKAGDAGFEFHVLPHIPVQLILWEGDEEFEPEANILFRENIADFLSPEDVAWYAGMLVYRLISLFYQHQ